ncbi:MAG TPA: MarR family transcriptional regulator [Propionicimonas sp.]|jgi:DNA-binding MarR family transcriptional regulator|nr:MarR family transcriptional regulator [Propionicimonas sp.]
MPETSDTDRLGEAVYAFMPAFLVRLHPLLHRTSYQGRSYSELEVVTVLGVATVGSLRPAALARDLAIEKGTLSSVIRRLEGLGLIQRERVAGDARGYRITLTAAGHDFVDHLADQRRRGFRALFAGLPPDQLDAAVRGLSTLTSFLAEPGPRPAG